MSTTTRRAASRPRITASPLQDHHVERHRHRRLQPMHHHAERIPDQDSRRNGDSTRRAVWGVVGGETHDRFPRPCGARMSGAVSRLISSCTTSETILKGAGRPKTGTTDTNG